MCSGYTNIVKFLYACFSVFMMHLLFRISWKKDIIVICFYYNVLGVNINKSAIKNNTGTESDCSEESVKKWTQT
jgi:hypothetical protein